MQFKSSVLSSVAFAHQVTHTVYHLLVGPFLHAGLPTVGGWEHKVPALGSPTETFQHANVSVSNNVLPMRDFHANVASYIDTCLICEILIFSRKNRWKQISVFNMATTKYE
jgi:hypothetical protein